MGSYEEEYRRYYSDVKSKLNIKSEIESYNNKSNLKNEEILSLNSSRDIYPKTKYDYGEEDIYNKEENYIIEDKGIGTYSGINNYSNQNSYRGFDGYNGRPHYGYRGGQNLNGGEEKNILSKWGKRVIIELFLTVVLFVLVIGIKTLPYKGAKTIYGSFKEIVNINFNYKNFIEDVRTVDVMKEVEEIKEKFKIKPDDVNTFKPEGNDENIDAMTLDKAKESTD